MKLQLQLTGTTILLITQGMVVAAVERNHINAEAVLPAESGTAQTYAQQA